LAGTAADIISSSDGAPDTPQLTLPEGDFPTRKEDTRMANNDSKQPENEWTILFYFVGDDKVSASIVSQLKAIKDAGFQKNTVVVARFDPNDKGTPTSMFEVNLKQKLETGTRIGDGKDPFVRNLDEDVAVDYAVAGPDKGRGEAIGKTPQAKALNRFLTECRAKHTAKHYMVCLVGHGGIVANDAFLPDEEPNSAITLKDLGDILKDFSGKARGGGGEFELLVMHSCSMSALEVAYQLKGTAKYMMASEGVNFVGTWPYRQILKKVFNTVNKLGRMDDTDVRRLVRKLHFLCLHNTSDFKFAGFSSELCLCNLNEEKVKDFSEPLRGLTRALKAGLGDERGKQNILLSHLEAQSYWQENYTDVYDFCRCLKEKCDEDVKRYDDRIAKLMARGPDGSEWLRELTARNELLKSISDACKAVMGKLEPEGLDRGETLDARLGQTTGEALRQPRRRLRLLRADLPILSRPVGLLPLVGADRDRGPPRHGLL
jgi:hypothetical protein